MFKSPLRISLFIVLLILLGITILVIIEPIKTLLGQKKLNGAFLATCDKVKSPFSNRYKESFMEGFVVYFNEDGMMQYGVEVLGMPSPVMKYSIEKNQIFYSTNGEVSYLRIIDDNTLEGLGCTWKRINTEEYKQVNNVEPEMKKTPKSPRKALEVNKNKKKYNQELEELLEDDPDSSDKP